VDLLVEKAWVPPDVNCEGCRRARSGHLDHPPDHTSGKTVYCNTSEASPKFVQLNHCISKVTDNEKVRRGRVRAP
jgi:hypothetical protein